MPTLDEELHIHKIIVIPSHIVSQTHKGIYMYIVRKKNLHASATI